ncbi:MULTISPECIES: TetR/AcrR family transcriptional regulator [Mycobacterium avium complex (MAC)]|jgi:AcrR family transcriptional regulator|uniref:TetR/AcrR family transcriptional regulator n=2 Tax=Mycobacterium avium TaxID=1764 RepID=A0A2A3L7Q7_MYCAV|nr:MULTISPECIES: TetR/AcrR family transcriptional regulator [Mycobacterium avium complex (MAC)]ETA95859.1 TetR family transcriptional regulator [Mycobacterium avium 05-4293]ETB01438.1 TetR family transcriptional regulator [Mycobacterium avium 10-5581]ETB02673.1 TetR family transcriptional regulator [Mycobacterium avium subsp. silvaticum ATCC 49884]ETB09584.1 TetR family transcriptional regulator [Mycobacterium avium subsp. avium 10-9275]ETB24136.1 TetR family transcriptional regulator [Mycobac
MQSHRADAAAGERTDLDRLILDTARGVFETYGVRRANIDDVAARAGVSRSTIYRRFPTKENLFGQVVRREAELFFSTLDQATAGCDPQQAVIEAFALGVRLVKDSALYSRIAESEPELFGLFSRSQVFPIRQFADGIAHTLRRCGAEQAEPDLDNIADILLRVALGIIVFPTDRLDTADPAAVRDYAARYLVPIIGR